MADSKLNRRICEVCESEFLHSGTRKTCSDACLERSYEEQRAETSAYRRSRTKNCPECRRVFSWEDIEGITESAFDRRTCCSAECWQEHQRKETASRNSIDYHGVRLSIEDVCKLEQKDVQTIKRLMMKGSIPGAQWAEPELRAQHARPRPPSAPKDEMIKVRMTREQKDVIYAYAHWCGLNTGADLFMKLAYEEMRRRPKP
jgi:hypothetical protein